jgi:hypothetical protein
MACTSITALARNCGEGIVAGLEKLYMVAFKDLVPVSGSTEVYSTATNGVVNEIGLDTGKSFVEIGLLKSTAGLEEKLTKDNSKGIAFLDQTFTLVLGDLSTENREWIESVMMQPVAVLIKSRTGKFYTSGLNGQFELSELTGGTGSKEDDQIGYTLTFKGISTKLIPQVEPSIVSGLI